MAKPKQSNQESLPTTEETSKQPDRTAILEKLKSVDSDLLAKLLAKVEIEQREEKVASVLAYVEKNDGLTIQGIASDIDSELLPIFQSLTVRQITDHLTKDLQTKLSKAKAQRESEDKPRKGRGKNLTEAEVNTAKDAVVSFLKKEGSATSISKIKSSLSNLNEKSIERAVKELYKDKKIQKLGEARATRYSFP